MRLAKPILEQMAENNGGLLYSIYTEILFKFRGEKIVDFL